MNKIRLLIVDDHQLFIEGLKSILEADQRFEFVDSVSSSSEVLKKLGRISIDIILLDINMPGINGFDILDAIKKHYNKIKVLMVSTYQEQYVIDRAFKNGANGYVNKSESSEHLLSSLISIYNGDKVFPKERIKIRNPDSNQIGIECLTKREIDILRHLKNGMTNKAIATVLYLSKYTVDTHRKNIMQKLQLKSTFELGKFLSENEI